MKEAKRNSNVVSLIVLFMAFTLIGIVLSYFYIIFQVNSLSIWANVIANFVIGLVLAALVWVIKRFMKITNDIMSLVVVILSLVIVLYVMWQMWFVIVAQIVFLHREITMFSDVGQIITSTRESIFGESYRTFIESLRFMNERGTWSLALGDGTANQVTGIMLSAVWVAETVLIIAFPIIIAHTSVGLYLAERGAWVKEKLMNYGFSAFDDEELDMIASGDIDVILQKPLEAQGEAMNAIAVCYHRGDPTEFIAIYKAGWDGDGTLSKGRHIMTVELGIDKIDALDAGLQAIHYPAPKAQTEKNDEPTNNVNEEAEASDNVAEAEKEETVTPVIDE